ncbi:hypothetical protein M9H77_27415 [Catharanthus roseus]|uniref:Uncharacterized protein n=1 Tax=Catharanthus roseus TaxID=4058 RepID=A0ACC0AF48_CATRO|nr:hypothetical protein M9H77_27415 [Catharanthus roseus]
MQPFIDNGLNCPAVAKLVTPMSVPSRLAEDIDCPIVAQDVAMHDTYENTFIDREIDEVDEICAERVVNDGSGRITRPSATRIIKGLRSVRMLRREAAKDLGKCVINVTVLNMIELQRLSDVVKSEILRNLWELKKDPSEKANALFEAREWVDGEICVQIHWGKDHWLMFIVDVLKHKITMLDSLRSCVTRKKSLVNEVRSNHHKALQHGLKDKHEYDVSVMKFFENTSYLKAIKKVKVDSTDRHSYVFKLFMSDNNMARDIVLHDLGYFTSYSIRDISKVLGLKH